MPELTAGRHDPELQPATVRQLHKPFARLGLPNSNIGEHVRFPKVLVLRPTKRPTIFAAVNERERTPTHGRHENWRYLNALDIQNERWRTRENIRWCPGKDSNLHGCYT